LALRPRPCRLASRALFNLLRAELAKERAVHAERLKIYADAETRMRDAFQAMSADALKSNNQAFLTLAESGCAKRDRDHGRHGRPQEAIDDPGAAPRCRAG
jgi:DNA recombination protein RmuC